ncbi:MAG TPA: DUF6503 family protein [Candidatus Binatia bacterium]|nr:DUF6503 family protein [Candidatus Binatia bacterium]
MFALAFVALAGFAAIAKAKTPPPPMGKADEKAAAVAAQLDNALGGMSAWGSVPYVRFDFVVVKDGKEVARFRHWWDKRHGMDRVEGPDDKGRMVAAIVNLQTRTGKSFTAGLPDRDSSEVAAQVDNAYQRWVNDSYWLMMPFKVRDPGTNLKYSGVKKGSNGVDYEVLELTFDKGVGLTSGDHYWLYVNPKTHLMDKWDYLLESMKPPAASATWEGWTKVGPVRFSTMHHFQGKPAHLQFENVATPSSMDESIFTDARPKY